MEHKTLIDIPNMGKTDIEFTKSFVDLIKPPGTSYTTLENTLIHDARNIIAENAIENGFDRVFWLDSDMVFDKHTLLMLSEDMDKNGLDFVSGLYFTRRPPKIRPVVYSKLWYEIKDDGTYEAGAKYLYDYGYGLMKCAGTGFGCCLVTVDLIKRVSDKFGSPFAPIPCMGEDLSFCWRANEIGAELYIDTRIKCGHIGKKIYTEADCVRGEKDA